MQEKRLQFNLEARGSICMIQLLILIIALVFVSPVWAGPWGQGPGRGMHYGLGPCADPELNLSPEQASRMKALQSDYQKNLRPLRMELMDKRAELRIGEPGNGKRSGQGHPTSTAESKRFNEQDSRNVGSL